MTSAERELAGFRRRLLERLLHCPECSEYEILKHFQSRGEAGFPDGLFQDALLLFQAHFRLFHTLYALQQELTAQRRYRLDISPLQIRLREYREPLTRGLDQADPMREYYLNPEHLEQTTRGDVERMLADFWARLGARAERGPALKVLGLDETAGAEEIRRRYRELAMRHHPDRGGSLERFQELQAAMARLRGY